jgi:uncharacterized protein involved in outer membrane biogenesis
MALGRKTGKIAAWIIAVLILVIAMLVIVFLTFDWNRARPWVDDKVSQAIGRQFQITTRSISRSRSCRCSRTTS